MNEDKQKGDLAITGAIDKRRMLAMFSKYGIVTVTVAHVEYTSSGEVEHECAVHVTYRDGRTICITD